MVKYVVAVFKADAGKEMPSSVAQWQVVYRKDIARQLNIVDCGVYCVIGIISYTINVILQVISNSSTPTPSVSQEPTTAHQGDCPHQAMAKH